MTFISEKREKFQTVFTIFFRKTVYICLKMLYNKQCILVFTKRGSQMKINWNEKYHTVSVYAIITFTVCLVIFTLMQNISVIMNGVKAFLGVCTPIIWGLVIAYLINPITKWTENALAKLTDKKKPHPKLKRILAVVISMLLFLAGITALIMIIIPQSVESIMSIFNNFDTYMENIESRVDEFLKNYPEISNTINSKFDEITAYINSLVDTLLPKVGDLIKTVKDGAVSVFNFLTDMLVGLIVAVYFLLDKEHFIAQCRKAVHALVPKSMLNEFLRICEHTNQSLSGFISGKIVDSVIIGILCFICMTIMGLDYAVLISVIIGVTNIIPVFGPIFGAIPGALLLLISSPNQFIPFIILVIVIQQLDGNVIGPKILGSSTGLSAFWVLFAILVGGGLFGFAGMLLGVPIFAVLYSLIEELLNSLLEKKGLSSKTEDYAGSAVSGKNTKPKPASPLTKKIELGGNKNRKKLPVGENTGNNDKDKKEADNNDI